MRPPPPRICFLLTPLRPPNPIPFLITIVSTDMACAPEDVEHAVGCRRKAHEHALGGGGAGGGERRPSVGRRAVAVQVVKEHCRGGRGIYSYIHQCIFSSINIQS